MSYFIKGPSAEGYLITEGWLCTRKNFMEQVGLLLGSMEGALIVYLDGQRNGKRTFQARTECICPGALWCYLGSSLYVQVMGSLS